MRLFVAVDLDDRLRHEVARLIARMRSEARDERSSRIAWVAPDRLHLTLHFIGPVARERVDEAGRTSSGSAYDVAVTR